jgi:hypothetical protein
VNRLDEIFDVGCQRDFHEAGMWVPSEVRCLACADNATVGSWCEAHHPSKPASDTDPDLLAELERSIARLRLSRDRCMLCGRPLVDGIERTTGICHLCRDRMLEGTYV